MTEDRPGLDRRTFLRGTIGAAALAGFGGPLLSACGSGATSKNNNATNSKVALPTLVQYTGVKPDVPRSAAAGNDGFFHYPASPTKATSSPPGKGGDVSAFVQVYNPIPPAVGQNEYWQELNKRLGVNLKISQVAAADYKTKSATIIAGGDLPDFMQIYGNVPQLPALLASKFQDLTEFLSGDAVKEYPFLANLPTASWVGSVYNGGIYGLPVPRPLGGSALYAREDLLEAKGLNPKPATWADLVDTLKQVTDARKGVWGLGNPLDLLNFVQQMMGLPNGWKEEGGKLTATNEVDGTKDALDALVKIIKAGYVHPDAFTDDISTKAKQWFNGGSAVFLWGAIAAWNGLLDNNTNGSSFKVIGRAPFSFDSSTKPSGWGGIPSFSLTALKKASKDRIKELLSIANYLAAPFGTDEFLFRNFGTAGKYYTKNGSDPVPVTKSSADLGLGVQYITASPYVYYYPKDDSVVKGQHQYETEFLPAYIKDPTLGLYSDTAGSKGATLDSLIHNSQLAILQGRQPVSSWDDTMKKWRQQGGDQIRSELEKALASR